MSAKVDINRSHFCVEVMEIKTVSTGPCWESHLHRLAFHLHGHRHGHLHQVPLKLHCNLRQNYMYMLGNQYWIYSGRDIFEMGKKPPFGEKTTSHSPFFCLSRLRAPHTKLWRDACQAMFSYWIAKVSHLLWTCVSQTFPQTFFHFVFLFLEPEWRWRAVQLVGLDQISWN